MISCYGRYPFPSGLSIFLLINKLAINKALGHVQTTCKYASFKHFIIPNNFHFLFLTLCVQNFLLKNILHKYTIMYVNTETIHVYLLEVTYKWCNYSFAKAEHNLESKKKKNQLLVNFLFFLYSQLDLVFCKATKKSWRFKLILISATHIYIYKSIMTRLKTKTCLWQFILKNDFRTQMIWINMPSRNNFNVLYPF